MSRHVVYLPVDELHVQALKDGSQTLRLLAELGMDEEGLHADLLDELVEAYENIRAYEETGAAA
jgi:hypothetical protein